MIYQTLAFVSDQLNAFLQQHFPSDTNRVVVADVAQSSASLTNGTENKIIVSLINIERDATATRTMPAQLRDSDKIATTNPTLNLNLDVMIASRFDDHYGDGLKLLSSVIGFFQARRQFTRQDTPSLPKGLDKLTVEWVDVTNQSAHNMWTAFGGRYLPSVVYKLRMLRVQEGWVLDTTPIITGTEVKG